MNFDIKIITNWRFLIPASVALLSLAFSIFNFIVGKITATKIIQNDLKHINVDIEALKEERKEIKINLRNDLNKIFRRLGKIDKGLAVREAICNERHGKKLKDK